MSLETKPLFDELPEDIQTYLAESGLEMRVGGYRAVSRECPLAALWNNLNRITRSYGRIHTCLVNLRTCACAFATKTTSLDVNAYCAACIATIAHEILLIRKDALRFHFSGGKQMDILELLGIHTQAFGIVVFECAEMAEFILVHMKQLAAIIGTPPLILGRLLDSADWQHYTPLSLKQAQKVACGAEFSKLTKYSRFIRRDGHDNYVFYVNTTRGVDVDTLVDKTESVHNIGPDVTRVLLLRNQIARLSLSLHSFRTNFRNDEPVGTFYQHLFPTLHALATHARPVAAGLFLWLGIHVRETMKRNVYTVYAHDGRFPKTVFGVDGRAAPSFSMKCEAMEALGDIYGYRKLHPIGHGDETMHRTVFNDEALPSCFGNSKDECWWLYERLPKDLRVFYTYDSLDSYRRAAMQK